jgi:hypothetical protein
MSGTSVRVCSHYEWRRDLPWDLCRFIHPEAHRWLPDPNAFADANEFHARGPSGRKALARAIYERLRTLEIQYDRESYNQNSYRQNVRTVHDVLHPRGVGTCLDLTLAFCGLCEGAALIPCVLLLERHVLAGVWLQRRWHDWEDRKWKDSTSTRRDWNSMFVGKDPPAAVESIQEAVSSGRMIALECTGFACSSTLQRGFPEAEGRDGGYLSFERAVEAGIEQLGSAAAPPPRKFLHVIDLAMGRHHERHGYTHDDIGEPPRILTQSSGQSDNESVIWLDLIDRQAQVEHLEKVVNRPGNSLHPPTCVVVGGHEDLHSSLVNRIVKKELADRVSVQPDYIWAGELQPVGDETVEEFTGSYLRKLANALLQKNENKNRSAPVTSIEELARFLVRDRRRWVIVSAAEVSPGDRTALDLVRHLTRFWLKVGETMGESAASRTPLPWIQVVPVSEAGQPWWSRLMRGRADTKTAIYKELNALEETALFQPLGLVNQSHLFRWRERVDLEARWLIQGREWGPVDRALFPNKKAEHTMLRVRDQLTRWLKDPPR